MGSKQGVYSATTTGVKSVLKGLGLSVEVSKKGGKNTGKQGNWERGALVKGINNPHVNRNRYWEEEPPTPRSAAYHL